MLPELDDARPQRQFFYASPIVQMNQTQLELYLMALRSIALSLVAFFAISGVAGADQANALAEEAGTMAVLGTAQTEIRPEIAWIHANVETRADTLDAAQTAQGQRMQSASKELESLVGLGVTVKRDSYFVRELLPPASATQPQSTPKPSWIVTNSFDLKCNTLSNLNVIINALASSGFAISNLNFSVKDERAALLDARRAATRDAITQANAYAEAAGVKLVAIKSLRDGEANPDRGYADLPSRKADAPLSIAIPETITFHASVQIDWTIRPGVP